MKKSTTSKKTVKPAIVKAVESVVKKSEPVNVLADPVTEKSEVKDTEKTKTAEDPKTTKTVKTVKTAAKTTKTKTTRTSSRAAKTAAKTVFVEIGELKVNTDELVQKAEEEFKKQYPNNEIKDIKAFYSAQKKKSAKSSSKTVPKKYGYGGDGSYERNGYSVKNISNKKEFPDNL